MKNTNESAFILAGISGILMCLSSNVWWLGQIWLLNTLVWGIIGAVRTFKEMKED